MKPWCLSVLRLRELYSELVSRGFFRSKEKREFLEEVVLEAVEAGIRDRKLVVVRAPPGIGKTAISVTLTASLLTGMVEEFLQLIHVVPTRALIEDLRRSVVEGFSKVLGDKGLATKIVTRQYGLAHEAPYLSGLFTVTTYDTYFYNIIKLPLDELRSVVRGLSLGHYEIPRATILSSINVFDEVHLVLEEGSEAAKSYLAVIRFLCEAGVPPLLLTATLPSEVLRRVSSMSKRGVVLVDYGSYTKLTRDSFYIGEVSKTLEPVDGGLLDLGDGGYSGLSKAVQEVAEEGSAKRVAIVVNTVEEAKRVYRELRNLGYSPVLLTSRLTPEDKEMKVRYVRENPRSILVSTQVIEVGVNLSFDAMISELAPPSSLVQRFGRLARYQEDRHGLWLVFYSRDTVERGSYVYDPTLVSCSGRYLREVLACGRRVHWHLPEVYEREFKVVGYSNLIEGCWSEYGCVDSPHLHEVLIDPTVDSTHVLNFIDSLRLREENLCTLYLLQQDGGCPGSIVELLELADLRTISMPCGVALDYAEKVLKAYGGRGVAEVRYSQSSGEGRTSRLECRQVDKNSINSLRKSLGRCLPVFGSTVAIAIPAELYDGGVFGEGLKEV